MSEQPFLVTFVAPSNVGPMIMEDQINLGPTEICMRGNFIVHGSPDPAVAVGRDISGWIENCHYYELGQGPRGFWTRRRLRFFRPLVRSIHVLVAVNRWLAGHA